MADSLLQFDAMAYQYPDSAWRLEGVGLAVASGEVLAVIGPNGSGKSTLLRIGAGVLRPLAGQVLLGGRDIARLARRDVARSLGYLPQQVRSDFDYRVEEVVAMGRFPHLAGAGFLSATDRAVVDRCLVETEVAEYRQRTLSRLSGGERQRVFLASVLAQEPRVLLLDEPTAALDLHHQVRFFRLVRRLARQGIGVAVVTHDVNLASLYCDRVALLRSGRLVEQGAPDAVLRPDVLQATYGNDVLLSRHPATGRPIVLPSGAGDDHGDTEDTEKTGGTRTEWGRGS
ncbi:MAG: ABC transporter ATP-binding protein [Planctomycetes bacterium]|nr:ABC transporter ATP-binding protein [Planctomycetota bacterium]